MSRTGPGYYGPRTWWMVARSIPGTLAGTCSLLLFWSFMAGSSVDRPDPLPAMKGLFIGAIALLGLGMVAAACTVVVLRRHPDLIEAPTGEPLTVSAGRLLWVITGAAVLASLGCFLTALVTHSDGWHFLQFVPFVAGLIGCHMLARRPVCPAPAAGPHLASER